MKKILSTILAAAAILPVAAQKEKPDTLFNATTASRLMIIDGADGLTVKALGSDSTETFNYHQTYADNVKVHSRKAESKRRDFDDFGRYIIAKDSINRSKPWHVSLSSSGIGIGFVSGLSTPDGMTIDPWRSAEISWLNALGLEVEPASRKFAISLGFGFTWRNYRMTDDNRFYTSADGQTTFGPYPADIKEYDHSRLKVFSLSMPLLFHYSIGKHTSFKLGPVLNFNTYSSIKTEYSDGIREVEELQKGQKRVPVTVDFLGCLNIWNGLGLFVRYSPCSVLKTDFGPKIKSLSFGFQFGL